MRPPALRVCHGAIARDGMAKCLILLGNYSHS